MRFWKNSPRLIRSALVLLVLPSCSCDGERSAAKTQAKARVSERVEATPIEIAAKEKLDSSNLHKDRKLLDRVWRMPWREARLRLNSHHVWQGSAKLSYEKVGGVGLSLDEEAELRYQDGTESLDVSVSNDGGFFQRVVFSNGMLYRKYQNGDYVASRDLETKRLHYADEAFALGATGWDLLGRLIALKPSTNTTVAGRACYCFALDIAAAPAAYEGASLKGILKDLKNWRASLSLESIDGSLCVDRALGVPISLSMAAVAARSFEGGSGKLNLSVSAGFVDLVKAPSIEAPEAYLKTLRRKRRKRPGTNFLKEEGIRVLPQPDAGVAR